jgi:phospholipid/cholesterol/gamma-HCH transport system substrate-binding protein
MRRLGLIAALCVAAGVLAVALGSSRAQGSSSARFDVIFDDARGLVGGQVVKVAGARAGTIQDVSVTSQFKARIEATVDSRFMPLHRNARCTIRPEGLIAENYIDCAPGTANTPVLKAHDDHPPTIPVANTTEPVSLLDLFNIFNLPTRQRFTVLVNELGIGTAARGDDFNDILRRANPALALARQAISILARQRDQLATIVDSTSKIAADGAGNTANVQRFLSSASALTTLTAAHADPLSRSVNLLPGLLRAADPALAQLDTVARAGTPLVQQLHAAVPALTRVQNDIGPFAAAAKPALASLRKTLHQASGAIRDTTPLVSTVRRYTESSLPGTKLFAKLGSNLQQRGFVENFLSVTYYIAASLARFDGNSHMLSILLVGAKNGLCGAYATAPVNGCSAHYGSQPAYRPGAGAGAAARTPRRASSCAGGPRLCARGASGRQRQPAGAGAPRSQSAAPPASAPARTGPAAASSAGGEPSGAPSGSNPSQNPPSGNSNPVQQAGQNLQSLVQYLLK